ncbi:MAG: hypothetical protein K2X97_18410, partial [Mycobacteriaceae bacterium]|nr:hypothetical protein [Mycobacteriaceae bacterium]
PTSPLGMFVRRLDLSFHLMPFEQVVRLASTISLFVLGSPADNNNNKATADRSYRTPAKVFLNAEEDVQIRDTALLIEQSIGNKSLEELRSQIDVATTSERSFFTLKEQAHRRYVLYLSTLARHDSQTTDEARTREAEEHLHVYFDYAFALASSVNKPSSSSSSSSSSSPSSSTPFDSGEGLIPYAALNLAQLHLALGNYNQGLVAVHEAIRISQERQDRYCTAHALYCLSKLIQEVGNRVECQLQRRALAEFLASCPREPHFAELSALNSLAVGNATPATTQDLLLKVDRIASITRYRQPLNDTLASQSKLARAQMWNSLGQSDLAHVHTLLQRHLYDSRSSAVDACSTIASLAWLNLSAGQIDKALALLQRAMDGIFSVDRVGDPLPVGIMPPSARAPDQIVGRLFCPPLHQSGCISQGPIIAIPS